MKNLVITITLLLTICTSRAQTYDSLPTELVHIRASSGQSYLTLNKDASLIQTKFGTPSAISSEFWEWDGITVRKLDYNGNLFSIHDNKLLSFELNNADFYVGKTDRAIRVGDKISNLATWYPNSYNNRGSDFMLLIVAFSPTDPTRKSEYISIEFNRNGTITKVNLVFD